MEHPNTTGPLWYWMFILPKHTNRGSCNIIREIDLTRIVECRAKGPEYTQAYFGMKNQGLEYSVAKLSAILQTKISYLRIIIEVV